MIPNRAKIPTISRAMSFTADSKAMATTSPSCFSRGVMWRAPNRMANRLRVAQKPSASRCGGASRVSTATDSVTALICRAM
jgi:hypothetical protein